jgi:phage minor structural protein
LLGDIDLSLTPEKIDLSLCLPNGTIIAKLNEVYDQKHTIKLGDLNELEFTVPPFINRNNIQIDNPNITKVRDRYLVKLTKGTDVENYIINKINEVADSDKDVKQVRCMSLGYELRDKMLRAYTATSYNCTSVLTEVLSDTIWNIGIIDAIFDLKFRSFDFSSTTVLDAVMQIATTFGAIIIWDTVNREIDFYQPANVGLDKGLTISYGKYLKDMNVEVNPDEMCTRLKCYGAEGLSIQDVNPTGANYIEDFTYFLYPFTRDIDKNVLTHSDYMSDSLCQAILDYNDLVTLKGAEFANLLAQKGLLQTSSI